MEYTLLNYAEYDINLFNRIFELCPDGVVCKDSDFRYVSINQSYKDMFGVNDERTFLGKTANIFLSEKNRQLITDADTEVRDYLKPINYVINIEKNKILNVTSSPIIKNGVFAGIISCIRDITQEEIIKEKFVNRHFNHINAEKQLQSQRETFVASVGHDLKNPVIAQIRGLELLLDGAFGELNKEQREIASMILDSCRYMKGMLSSLLDTYRNYGGEIKLDFSEFSLTELVNECVSEMLYVAGDKELKILPEYSGAHIISADRIQIRRVIMNLLTNAIKYAYKSTDLILRVFEESGNVYFEFENKSPFIPEEKQKTLFEKYVSYAEIHKELGTGLGLYASKKIIESHNGKIYLKSFRDDRNIFGFRVPVEQNCNIVKEISL